MASQSKIIGLCLFVQISTIGCGDSVDLERVTATEKATLRGTFLTESPDEISFPVKVLFAIDCSLSMGDEIMGQLVGSFNFHTFLLLGMFPPGSEGDQARRIAENTLQGMADEGNGQFRLFETAEAIDFISIVDMRLTVEYTIKYLLAYNYNSRPGIETLYVDSDGDGLIDVDWYQIAMQTLDPNNPDDDWGHYPAYYFKITMVYHPGQSRP